RFGRSAGKAGGLRRCASQRRNFVCPFHGSQTLVALVELPAGRQKPPLLPYRLWRPQNAPGFAAFSLAPDLEPRNADGTIKIALWRIAAENVAHGCVSFGAAADPGAKPVLESAKLIVKKTCSPGRQQLSTGNAGQYASHAHDGLAFARAWLGLRYSLSVANLPETGMARPRILPVLCSRRIGYGCRTCSGSALAWCFGHPQCQLAGPSSHVPGRRGPVAPKKIRCRLHFHHRIQFLLPWPAVAPRFRPTVYSGFPGPLVS